MQNNHNDIQENEKLIEELKHTTIDQMIELLNLSFQNVVEFQKLVADAILNVRRELGFKINESKYKALVKASVENNSAHITDYYKTLVEKHKHEL